MRIQAPWKVPQDHILGDICNSWNFKWLFQKCHSGWCMLYMHNSCLFLFLNLPLLCWPPFSCTCLFHAWKKQNWKFKFCSGERVEVNSLWKIWKMRQKIFVHPLLFLGAQVLSPTQQPVTFEPLGTSKYILCVFERFELIPFSSH